MKSLNQIKKKNCTIFQYADTILKLLTRHIKWQKKPAKLKSNKFIGD